MKTKIFSLVLFFLISSYVYAQGVPDALYYKFKNNPSSTLTPNYANPGVGTNPAPVLAPTPFGPGGQFDSCLVGTGATNGGVNTGWNCDLGSGSWTISMWITIPTTSSGSAFYLFGDPGSGSFRCFHNGVALPDGLVLRGTGMTDVTVTGIGPAPTVVTFVYDASAGNVKAYKNGVLANTVAQTLNITVGSGFKVGGYSSSATFIGKLDEFRLYKRALDAAEVAATWNQELPLGPSVCNYYSSQWCAAGTFPNLPAATFFQASAWLGDTLYVQAPTSAGAGANTIYRYTYGGSWSTGVPLPVTRVGGTLTACNGKLYYIGGGVSSISTGQTADVYEYNPSTGAWTTKAPMPLALAAHGAGNWGDSVIFVWGGPYTGSTTQLNVYYYRVGSNTWGTITNSLPTGQGRRTFSYGLSGNKLFMAAGYNTTYLKSFYVGTIGSNASQLTWTAGPDVPTTFTGLSRPGGVAFQNYFYMIGGEQAGGGYHQTAYVWIINQNAWHPTTIQPKPTGMSNIFSACAAKCINDTVKVFVPGGYDGAGSANFEVIGCGPTITGNSTIISNVPSAYSLSQNYPNPFNPSTKISFSLPKAGSVKLVVYDILGKEVTTLVNDYRTAGIHSVEFNASNLASGVYLYRIEAGDFRDVKKMMLVK